MALLHNEVEKIKCFQLLKFPVFCSLHGPLPFPIATAASSSHCKAISQRSHYGSCAWLPFMVAEVILKVTFSPSQTWSPAAYHARLFLLKMIDFSKVQFCFSEILDHWLAF